MYVLGYRTCEDGIHVIREERFCDGSYFSGCRDESDEMFITCSGFRFIGCSSGYFKCALDNLCVRNELICDGTFNCKANLTDEDFSVCAEWKCDTGFIKLSGNNTHHYYHY